MRQLLRLIVTHGTGRNANAPGFRVGGKTGTAEKVSSAGGYSRSVNVSTFAAAFPMDEPRYVVLVMMDAPRGNAEANGCVTTAAWTAAPVVSRRDLAHRPAARHHPRRKPRHRHVGADAAGRRATAGH